MIAESFKAAINFEILGVVFNLPDFTTIFDQGIGSAIGWVLSFAFTGLLVIWVVFSIIAAYKITRSGMEKELEEGMTLIKNVWMSASGGLLFFAVVSIVGAFIGVGSLMEWPYTLAQCHDVDGGFYFMDIASLEMNGIEVSDRSVVQCCRIDDVTRMSPSGYYDAGYEDGTYHFVVGNPGGVSECEDF